MSELRMLVFDLDDTLYSELDFVVSGFSAVEKHLCSSQFPNHMYAAEFWKVFETHGSGRVFNTVLDKLEIPYTSEQLKKLVSVYRNHQPSISARTGVRQIITALKTKNIRLGIITDGDETIQTGKLKALGLLNQFEIVLCTDELGPNRVGWKPSSLPFRTIEERSGLAGSALAYVGDNPHKDFQGAHQQRWQTIRLRVSDQLHHSVPTPEGVIEVKSIDEILGVLN